MQQALFGEQSVPGPTPDSADLLPPVQTSEQLARSYQLLERHVVKLSHDLEHANAEKDEELREKTVLASRMQALLDVLPGGVVVLDASGRVVENNPAVEYMLGVNAHGRMWRDVIAECFAPRSDDGLEVSTVSGKRISVATASLESAGQIILLTDQTQTRQLQQQVSRNEKLSAIGKMVSALAHQIRTPLSAAILYANHLCEKDIEPRQRQKFASKLLGRLNHMERQVRDMLLFVRNELPLNEVICLADLQTGLMAAMEVPLIASKSRCIWQNPNPQVRIRCNREALISALLNLVNNAIQASQNPTKLKISFVRTALQGEPALAIAIADNGPGMPAAELATAQDMFYTTKPQGTGLGLAVVKSVARAHGGHFSLRSQPGRGTCGTLILPMVEDN